MKKLVVLLLTVSMLLSGFSSVMASEVITIVDAQEQVVKVPQPVERIVSISGALSEILSVLGASDRMIGRDGGTDFPPVLLELPVVAENSFRPQLEAILELQPDLIIADTMLNADNRAKLESFGIPVVVEQVSNPNRLFTAITNLGEVIGELERAKEVITFISDYESLIIDRVANVPESSKPRVFWEWNAPFKSGSKTSTTGPRITLAGGINIAEEVTGDWPVLSGEYVWEEDPEVIIKMASREDSSEVMVAHYEEIISRVGVSETSAVKNERVHVISWTVHNGIRSIVGSLHYAKWFHPELFLDLEPEVVHSELLSEFYNLDLATLGPTIYPN